MQKLNAAFFKAVLIISAVCLTGFLTWVLIFKLFGFLIPTVILALIMIICPGITGIYCMSVWDKNKNLLTAEERKSIGAHIFVISGVCQILFSIIGLCMLISSL